MLASRMVDIRPIWQFQDKIAFGFNVVFSIATFFFTFFIVWFVFKKINGLIYIRKLEFLDDKKEFLEEVRAEYNAR